MAMISYAQNREDVLLARAFTEPSGFYVDVGASDPVVHSVTKWFYDRGWSGVNIEPHQPTFARLDAARPRDINLNIAVSETEGTFELFEIPHADGLHTLEPAVADKVRAEGHAVHVRSIPCRRLAEVCAEHVGDRAIDFLKVDAEGHEKSVLAGMDFVRWRPRVLVIEATEPCSTVPSHEGWEPIVLRADYRFAFFDGLNRYYVREEDADVLVPRIAVPASVFDEFTPYEQIAAVQKEEAATAATRAERDAAVAATAAAQAETAGVHQELAQVREVLSQTRNDCTRLNDELAQARGELDAVRGTLAQSLGEVDALRAELTAATGREDSVRNELTGARVELANLRGELGDLHDELTTLRATTVNRAALAAAMSILAATRAQLEQTRAALFALSPGR